MELAIQVETLLPEDSESNWMGKSQGKTSLAPWLRFSLMHGQRPFLNNPTDFDFGCDLACWAGGLRTLAIRKRKSTRDQFHSKVARGDCWRPG